MTSDKLRTKRATKPALKQIDEPTVSDTSRDAMISSEMPCGPGFVQRNVLLQLSQQHLLMHQYLQQLLESQSTSSTSLPDCQSQSSVDVALPFLSIPPHLQRMRPPSPPPPIAPLTIPSTLKPKESSARRLFEDSAGSQRMLRDGSLYSPSDFIESPDLALSLLSSASEQQWFLLLATSLQQIFSLPTSALAPFDPILNARHFLSAICNTQHVIGSMQDVSQSGAVSMSNSVSCQSLEDNSAVGSDRTKRRKSSAPDDLYAKGVVVMRKSEPAECQTSQMFRALLREGRKQFESESGALFESDDSSLKSESLSGSEAEPAEVDELYFVPGLTKRRSSSSSSSKAPNHESQSVKDEDQPSKISFYTWDAMLVDLVKLSPVQDSPVVPSVLEWVSLLDSSTILFANELEAVQKCKSPEFLSTEAQALRQHVLKYGKKSDGYKRLFGWTHLKGEMKTGRSQMLNTIFWSIFIIYLYHLPECQHLKVSAEQFADDYLRQPVNPLFAKIDSVELKRLVMFRDIMKIAFLIIPAHRNEVLLLRVAACLERSGKKYQISSSGQMLATTRRRLIYRREAKMKLSVHNVASK